MASTQDNDDMASTPKPEMALPLGFETIEQIKSIPILPNGSLQKNFVNVIGFVMDYQPPIKTRGEGKLPIVYISTSSSLICSSRLQM